MSRRAVRVVFAFAAGLAALGLPGILRAEAVPRDQIHWIAGGPSHGYGEHEYRAGALLLREALDAAQDRFEVIVHEGWPASTGAFERAAAIVLSMDGDAGHLAFDHTEEVDALAKRGVGVLALHWAVHAGSGRDAEAMRRWIGGAYETGVSTNPKWKAVLRLDERHPISRGVRSGVEIYDEWYFNIAFAERSASAGAAEVPAVVPVATAVPSDGDRTRVSSPLPWARPPAEVLEASGRRETLVWTTERADGGRGVGFTGGHFHWNLGNDDYRRLLLNAVLWVAGGEVPPEGVPSETPTLAALEANQDRRRPWRFDADAVRSRFQLASADAGRTSHVPLDRFVLPDDLEITLFAQSPLLYNPTNIDIDAEGRVWVLEGWNYRGWPGEREAGDRVVILEDEDGDGRADNSRVFVQEPALRAPLGIAVIGNRVLVSMSPHLIEYTDVDGDLRFDPAVDRRRVLLSGLGDANSDHALHSITVGPDGRLYGSVGDDGSDFEDAGGRRFRLRGRTQGEGPPASPSADGHVYVGGAAFRMRSDASELEIIGHNFRNSYEQAVTSFGDVFHADNDDGPASRTSWVMPHANFGYRSNDGTRKWILDRRPGESVASAHWRQRDPGIAPAGDVYGDGAPAGVVFNEGMGLGERYRGTLIVADTVLESLLAYRVAPRGAGFALERFDLLTTNPARSLGGTDQSRGEALRGIPGAIGRRIAEARALDLSPTWIERTLAFLGLDRAYAAPAGADSLTFRPVDVALGTDGVLYVADWLDAYVGGNTMADLARRGAIYRVAKKGEDRSSRRRPESEGKGLAIDRALLGLESPAVHVRALAAAELRKRGAAAFEAVASRLSADDPYLRARVLWLLPALGERGVERTRALLSSTDAQTSLVAFRSLRSAGHARPDDALRLARSAAPAARREAALAMRDQDWERARDVLVEVARRIDADDPWQIEALGTGAHGKERELYAELVHVLPGFAAFAAGKSARSGAAHARFAAIAWRLHPPEAVGALTALALAASAAPEERARAVDALAFVPTAAAADALRRVAEGAAATAPALADQAAWWLDRNAELAWASFETSHARPRLYQPQLFIDFRAAADAERREIEEKALPTASEIAALDADASAGRALFASGRVPCSGCHRFRGSGSGTIGPDLSDAGQRFGRQQLIARMLQPTSDIMPSARLLGLDAQEVADLAAYLTADFVDR